MSGATAEPAIRIALTLTDSELADRIAVLLADAAGIILVDDPEEADALLVSAKAPAATQRHDDPLFTPRELEVLALLAEGASNKTIAEALGISVHTAKFHVGQVIDKLDAVGRTDAVAQAARIGVIRL
jgi:DNA-binding CsgD family transcriptional regulator